MNVKLLAVDLLRAGILVQGNDSAWYPIAALHLFAESSIEAGKIAVQWVEEGVALGHSYEPTALLLVGVE